MAEAQQGRTGKQLASRIPLDYVHHPSWVERLKRWMALLALLAAVAWVALGLRVDGRGVGLNDWGRLQGSRGPVAEVHASWDANCEACHAPFGPMSGENWMGSFHAVSQANQRCQTCHAGPPHHREKMSEPEVACGSCHRDHRGRNISLIDLNDSDCTRCHNGLDAHVKSGASTEYAKEIRSFSAGQGHPEFRSLEAAKAQPDPGRGIKFNHALHVAPGLVKDPGDTPFTWAYIRDDAQRARYARGQADSASIALTCADCHVTDAGDLGLDGGALGKTVDDPSGRLASRSAGAYMQPITYENQCRACHPLTVDEPAEGDDPALALNILHGLQPAEVHAAVYQAAAAAQLAAAPDLLDARDRPDPMPGREAEAELRSKQVREAIDGRVARVERMLFAGAQTCYECHHYVGEPAPEYECRDPKTDAPPPVVLAPGEVPKIQGQSGPLQVVRPQIPQVWYEHARFDHAPHRAMDCLSCHGGAPTSCTSRDILLPDMQNCQQCHAPAGHAGGKPTGGVAYQCTECHRYHNGDAPRQGIGALARGVDPSRRMSIEQFLNATPPARDGSSPPPPRAGAGTEAESAGGGR